MSVRDDPLEDGGFRYTDYLFTCENCGTHLEHVKSRYYACHPCRTLFYFEALPEEWAEMKQAEQVEFLEEKLKDATSSYRLVVETPAERRQRLVRAGLIGGNGRLSEWKPRRCPECGKGFRPMTDAMWKNVRKLHLETSVRHGLH